MSWQIVIEFGRNFDIEIIGRHKSGPPQYVMSPEGIAIPFDDRESAEAAQREIRVYVRPVHDAGGEDYRPVVQGEVIKDRPALPWDDPAIMKRDLRQAVSYIEASGGPGVFNAETGKIG